MSYFERELPPGCIIKHPAWRTFKNFGVQWSKLVAWSWLNVNSAGSEEPDLRKSFIRLLHAQAKNTEIYVKCDTRDPDNDDIDLALPNAEAASKAIKKLLLGETMKETLQDIPELVKIEQLTSSRTEQLTLSKVLEKYTEQPLMTTANEDLKAMFEESVNVRVITDSFVGRIIYAQGKDATSPDKDKYILELAYPPRPTISDPTNPNISDSTFITKDTLKVWLNRDDSDPIRYATPPSAYIPWSGC